MTTLRTLLFALVLVPAVVACDEALDEAIDLVATDNPEAELAVDAMQQGSLEGALLAALLDNVELTDVLADMAADGRLDLDTTFTPAGCIQSTLPPDSVSLTFDNCSGPYGLTGLSGAANLTFLNSGEEGVEVNLTAVGLEVNGATVGVSVQGTAADSDAGVRQYDLTTGGAGATRDGVPVGRAGNYTATVDAGCLVLEGAWSITIETDAKVATFTNFKRCAAACPDSGSLVWAGSELSSDDIVGGAEGLALTFRNGSDTVAWVDGDAKAGVTRLECGGN
jgi:hypothetical protein